MEETVKMGDGLELRALYWKSTNVLLLKSAFTNDKNGRSSRAIVQTTDYSVYQVRSGKKISTSNQNSKSNERWVSGTSQFHIFFTRSQPKRYRCTQRSTSTLVQEGALRLYPMPKRKPLEDPANVLRSSGCLARTLTISDQHATILLENKSSNGSAEETSDVKSLLKLTVQPFHLESLASSDDESQSTRILDFLQAYDFQLSSESGAEYSYYRAVPKQGLFSTLWTSLYGKLFGGNIESSHGGVFTAELISPATDSQVKRAMPAPAVRLVQETPALYEKVTLPYIRSIVEGGSLSWIQNIVDGTKEKERLLLDTNDYILNIDTKWRSHPDPHTVPRPNWLDHTAVSDLYCLAIVKANDVASLRDLTGDHLPILRSIVRECPAVIHEIYGVSIDQLRIFCHYQPQFYHFHVHFTRLYNEIGCQVERGHLLTDIIQNLEMDSNYYSKRTISYKLPVTNKLYQLISEESKMSEPSY
jgi:m7GpppX diphosphatase